MPANCPGTSPSQTKTHVQRAQSGLWTPRRCVIRNVHSSLPDEEGNQPHDQSLFTQSPQGTAARDHNASMQRLFASIPAKFYVLK
jgi:hypothetical protein